MGTFPTTTITNTFTTITARNEGDTRRVAGATLVFRGERRGVEVYTCTTTKRVKGGRIAYTYRLISDGPRGSWRVDYLGTAGRIYESACGGASFPTITAAVRAMKADREERMAAPVWLV